MLFRDLYRGEIVWNRTRKRNRWGETRVANRPEVEWLRVPAPALRIVSETLWTAAHQRIAESRANYQAMTKGSRGSRPKDVESKYLLPGFARCGCCQGGLHVRSSNSGSPGHRRRAFSYACTAHFNRGPDICPNALRVRMEAADAAVLAALRDILPPDLVDDVVARVRELQEQPTRPGDVLRDRIASELAAVDGQLANLTDAIAVGGDLPVLVRRLQEADRRRQELVQQLRAMADGPMTPRIDWGATEARARRLLADWRGLLSRQVAHGREVLRQILVAPIVFTPYHERGRRGYRFVGEALLTGLFEGLVEVMRLASPMPGSWNRIVAWLQQVEGLRRSA